MLRYGLLMIVVLAALPADSKSAETVTMAFGGLVSGVTIYEENQLRLSSSGQIFVASTSLPDPPGMFPSSFGMPFVLTALHGGTFDMVSIDMRELNETVGAQTFSFIGNREDGSTVQLQVTTDGICCQAGDNFGVETFDLSTLTGLVSLQWSSVLLASDDLVVTLNPPDPLFEDRFEF